jgi:hypothetical protein
MAQKTAVAILIVFVTLGTPLTAVAQGLESLGNRATAMAAFVAVADDASAVAWNPAGLVSGPIFNVSIDLGRSTRTPEGTPEPPAQAGRVGTILLAVGTTPVGLAYYRLAATTVVADPAVIGSADRQDRQAIVRTLVTSHIGATVQQSVGEYLTLGATIKLVRGTVGAGSATVASWAEALARTDQFDADGSTTGDVDLGVMVAVRRLRAGVVVRNATEPTFRGGADGALEASLARHARVGIAWGDRWPGLAGLTVAMDADLTRVPHPAGERRDMAAGVERWLRGRKVGIRGGVRVSTVGEARPLASAGASYAVRVGTYIDAYVSGGREVRGWGVAARMTY